MLSVPQLDGHEAHRVQPVDARKDYICPGCGHGIPSGQGHVVAWPDEYHDGRRHWHHHCWRAAVQRGRIA